MSTLLRVGAVAQRLGISRDTVYDWVRRGYLTPTRTPTNQLMFDEDEVEALRNGTHRPRRIAVDHAIEKEREPAPKTLMTMDPPETKSWKDLPPWETEVEAARAALTVDELIAVRQQQAEERESARAEAEACQNFERAEARRLALLKQYVFRVLYIPFGYRQEIAEAVEAFTTSSRVPAWLAPWEQQQIVVSHAREIIAKRDAEVRRREAEAREQQAEAARIKAEASSLAIAKLGQQVQAAFDRAKKKSEKPERPSTLSEALRARRGNQSG